MLALAGIPEDAVGFLTSGDLGGILRQTSFSLLGASSAHSRCCKGSAPHVSKVAARSRVECGSAAESRTCVRGAVCVRDGPAVLFPRSESEGRAGRWPRPLDTAYTAHF